MTSLLLIALFSQSLETAKVESRPVDRLVTLTAEVMPFQSAAIVARVPGYLESVAVDRGTYLKKGQIIARLSAPELQAQLAEAEAKAASLQAHAAEAKARLAAAQSTSERLKSAGQTAGAVAQNEVILASETVKAAQAALESIDLSRSAALAQVRAAKDLEAYLLVTAPFEGTVTERILHPGALAGPAAGPIVKMEQLQRLRIVVAVPEQYVSSVRAGQTVEFSVTGFPGETFRASVARSARVIDPLTRTMPVELDFSNPASKVAPGMYTEVKWPASQAQVRLLVPATAVAANTERSFVIKVDGGVTRYVNVRKGAAYGDLVEILGPLAAGDIVIRRATDEIREGIKLPAK